MEFPRPWHRQQDSPPFFGADSLDDAVKLPHSLGSAAPLFFTDIPDLQRCFFLALREDSCVFFELLQFTTTFVQTPT